MTIPPSKLNAECIVRRESSVICAAAGEDLVMVSIENGFYYGVSDVAREVWRELERPVQVSHLLDRLCANYDIDRRTCERDTLAFLDQLLAERLLQVTDAVA